MSGAHQTASAPAVLTDEDALRSLQALVASQGLGSAYLPATTVADGSGAVCPALKVFDSAGAEIACVVIAPRAKTFLVTLVQDGETARLLVFRTALEAAAMIWPSRHSSAVSGSMPGGSAGTRE